VQSVRAAMEARTRELLVGCVAVNTAVRSGHRPLGRAVVTALSEGEQFEPEGRRV
jgi:hypothetical protein